jgi:hypothetical protein
LTSGDEAGVYDLALQQDRTSAALSFAAALFGADQTQFFAKDIEQSPVALGLEALEVSVDSYF